MKRMTDKEPVNDLIYLVKLKRKVQKDICEKRSCDVCLSRCLANDISDHLCKYGYDEEYK
jgi:hypothetical protein